jgi:hypothetical protein
MILVAAMLLLISNLPDGSFNVAYSLRQHGNLGFNLFRFLRSARAKTKRKR